MYSCSALVNIKQDTTRHNLPSSASESDDPFHWWRNWPESQFVRPESRVGCSRATIVRAQAAALSTRFIEELGDLVSLGIDRNRVAHHTYFGWPYSVQSIEKATLEEQVTLHRYRQCCAVRQEEDVGSSKIKCERHVPMNLDQADLAENG